MQGDRNSSGHTYAVILFAVFTAHNTYGLDIPVSTVTGRNGDFNRIVNHSVAPYVILTRDTRCQFVLRRRPPCVGDPRIAIKTATKHPVCDLRLHVRHRSTWVLRDESPRRNYNVRLSFGDLPSTIGSRWSRDKHEF